MKLDRSQDKAKSGTRRYFLGAHLALYLRADILLAAWQGNDKLFSPLKTTRCESLFPGIGM